MAVQESEAAAKVAYSRNHPFMAPVLRNVNLNGPGSAKETRHLELLLEGSGIRYECGDSLGVFPTNDSELVDLALEALKSSGEELVVDPQWGTLPLRAALLRRYELNNVPPNLVRAVAERSGDTKLAALAEPGNQQALEAYADGRDSIDLILEHPAMRFSAQEFLGCLRRMRPRLYSIASGPTANPGRAHLTVAVVRYEHRGRSRLGVASTYLAERIGEGGYAPVFLHRSKFRMPEDGMAPMIMVGPGTGVAPFRAFLQEREALGHGGDNWLFFGDQRGATDFLYGGEFEAMRQRGVLKRLSLAWSREGSRKVYVQHLMLEAGAEIWAWLERGAHFYVCGDAERMAAEVDEALREIVRVHGGRDAAGAAEYLEAMKKARRYQRDVY
ncbi:MAG TPA: sulfite reductase subunit alpha [Verrucomicrobiae bacterium]|nr:sulfite reductase subunit alpha [Verrucomicrobiae bacterium]